MLLMWVLLWPFPQIKFKKKLELRDRAKAKAKNKVKMLLKSIRTFAKVIIHKIKVTR